jgi:hypothetical protein
MAAATLGLQTPVWSQVGRCRPTSPRSDEVLNYLQYLATSTDSSAIYDRRAIGLSTISTRKVNLLGKSATCAAAAIAVNTLMDEAGTARAVWVYQYDRQYVVVDPEFPAPDGTPLFFFDSQWTPIIGIGFYHFP